MTAIQLIKIPQETKKPLEFTVLDSTGAPYDLSGFEVSFTVHQGDEGQGRQLVKLTKTLNPTQVSVSANKITVTILPANTAIKNVFPAVFECYYWLRISNGTNVIELFKGRFQIERGF
jgi:hypothetical protein